MDLLIIAGVDISHARLVDLTQLANQAKPFYDWVEAQFRITTGKHETLHDLLLVCGLEEIQGAIRLCYQSAGQPHVPFLFDGGGRSYQHTKACYYFFSWLIRDAPRQRLAPLIQRIVKQTNRPRPDVEIEVLAVLIYQYRSYVRTFSWDAIREVIIDRLEGSRRSIRGHEQEIIVRTAFITAIQAYYEKHKGYGVYAGAALAEKQVIIHNESYDVCVNLQDDNERVSRRILVAIKTRETEGGGHSHLFSRDMLSAVHTARRASADDYLVVVIVAAHWSQREIENLYDLVDHLVIFEVSPGAFRSFDNPAQNGLNRFIESVFGNHIEPKPDR